MRRMLYLIGVISGWDKGPISCSQFSKFLERQELTIATVNIKMMLKRSLKDTVPIFAPNICNKNLFVA